MPDVAPLKPWTIKDSLSNLLPEAEYQFRLESVTPGESKATPPNPILKWVWVVVGGEYDGKKQFSTFTLRSDVIGILGATLAATQAFEEDEELPDDKDQLARTIESKIGGKVFDVKYSHRVDKNTRRVWPDIVVTGPSMSAFK
jgi:hypothetical protein